MFVDYTVAAGFAPWRVRPDQVSPTSTQLAIKCLKFILLLPRKKDNTVRTMKQNIYFSFFNPLMVTGELKIESLGGVHGGELAMRQNQYHLTICGSKPFLFSRSIATLAETNDVFIPDLDLKKF